jgi:poly-gamma-glutamate capsule biosynthesis protein CapA/YwtB (metallophosphatase superfamily)
MTSSDKNWNKIEVHSKPVFQDKAMSNPFKRIAPLIQITSIRIFLIVLFAFLLAGCQPESAPPQHADTPPYEIIFVGDVLLGDAAQPFLDEHGYLWPFEHINHLMEGDYAIANGEGPITVIDQPWDPDQVWSYNAQPETAKALADYGFDAVGFANNHSMDRGPEGVSDTRTHIDSNNMKFFGAGSNLAEAEAPLLIETPYGLVGVVGLGDNWGKARTATKDHAGTVPLSKSSIRRGYQLARDAGAEWVIAYVHWGRNYTDITDTQRRWAREFAREGYHLVIGHGAHSIQFIEVINGMPVVYSVGNFVFGTPGRFTEDYPGFGLVVTAELHVGGFHQLSFACIQTDNQVVNFQPRPCTPAQAQQVFSSIYDDLIIEEDTAILEW